MISSRHKRVNKPFVPCKPFPFGNVGRLKGAPLGQALLTNIRLGWKRLPGTKTAILPLGQ